MNYIDLHVHSTYSDGMCTPAELVKLAQKKHLSYIALTDHDTVEGIPDALAAAKGRTVTVIPGVELSSDYKDTDIHIVGLDIDYQNVDFTAHLEHFQQERIQRNRKMCMRLADAGFSITYDALLSAFPDAVLTRAHFARFLYDSGEAKSTAEVFNRYIGSHCPCYVPREKVTPMHAVSLIKKAGGTAVLAHPMLYHMNEAQLCELIEQLKQFGLDGIEAIYSCNTENEEAYVRSLASRYHLAISGGSDFHGSNKPDIDLGCGKGNLRIPQALLSELLPSHSHA